MWTGVTKTAVCGRPERKDGWRGGVCGRESPRQLSEEDLTEKTGGQEGCGRESPRQLSAEGLTEKTGGKEGGWAGVTKTAV